MLLLRPVITSFYRVGHALGLSRPLSIDVMSRRLGYTKYGDPGEVVTLEEEKIECDLEPEEVLAKYLVCPVNPADINVIQGTYPIRPPLPATGGGEGVAQIVAAGSGSHLQPGDWVLPGRPMTGTWRSHLVTKDSHWIKVTSIKIAKVGIQLAKVLPCRMKSVNTRISSSVSNSISSIGFVS